MSVETNLVCKPCGVYIWIGQSSPKGYYLYTTDEQVKLLTSFLEKHKSYDPDSEHQLIYANEVYNGPYEEEPWIEVEE